MAAANIVIRVRQDAFDPGGPLEAYAESKQSVVFSVCTSMEEGAAYAGGAPARLPHANGPHSRSPFGFFIMLSGHLLADTEQFNQISSSGRLFMADLVDRGFVEVLVNDVAQTTAAVAAGTIS